MFRGKRKLVIPAVAVVVAVTAGVGYALWTAHATGNGGSQSLSAVVVTVTADTGAADLYPGFTGGDVYFTLSNGNPYPVTFSSMTPGTITSSNEAACPASNLTVATVPNGLSLAAGANTSAVARSISDVATLASGAPDGCQGITFTIALTLTGTQV